MVLAYIRFLFAYANSGQNGEVCQGVGCTAGSSSRRQSQLPVGRQSAHSATYQSRPYSWWLLHTLTFDLS